MSEPTPRLPSELAAFERVDIGPAMLRLPPHPLPYQTPGEQRKRAAEILERPTLLFCEAGGGATSMLRWLVTRKQGEAKPTILTPRERRWRGPLDCDTRQLSRGSELEAILAGGVPPHLIVADIESMDEAERPLAYAALRGAWEQQEKDKKRPFLVITSRLGDLLSTEDGSRLVSISQVLRRTPMTPDWCAVAVGPMLKRVDHSIRLIEEEAPRIGRLVWSFTGGQPTLVNHCLSHLLNSASPAELFQRGRTLGSWLQDYPPSVVPSWKGELRRLCQNPEHREVVEIYADGGPIPIRAIETLNKSANIELYLSGWVGAVPPVGLTCGRYAEGEDLWGLRSPAHQAWALDVLREDGGAR